MQILKSLFWLKHRREILIPSLCVTGAFLCGLIAGALILHALTPVQQGELHQYLTDFLRGVESLSQNRAALEGLKVWQEILKTQIITFIFLWISGLTVVGIPLIVLIIGVRGFILGFTVGFLVQERAWQGLILALVAVLPQNLCYVPALLGAGILAFYFSFFLFRGPRDHSILASLLVYSLVFLLTFFLALIGTLLETYLVPGAVRLTLFLT